MIDLKTSKNEIEKLKRAALSFPPDDDGVIVLAKALAKHAQSETHAAAVVDSWIEKWPQWPKPSEVTQLCQVIADPKQAHARAQREKCGRCGGSGYVEVQGEFGMTAAYPCTHLPMTDSDARMGLKIPPAMRPGYMRERREAEPRAEVWRGSGGKPNQDELKRVNAATIGKIMREYE
ncbi:MAG TPA: hypothetical protein VFC21_11965 [Bryobacteraceae bacterium]|nr:hypothetical protein [Bryobacteraceae bacterium]